VLTAGKHGLERGVSVIDTASYAVVATIAVPGPGLISIVPPPQGVPFLSLNAKLNVALGRNPNQAAFRLGTSFTLSSTASNGIHPATEQVKLQAGPFITTLPAGSFRRNWRGWYTYEGVINGVKLEAKIEPTGTLRYVFQAKAVGTSLSGITNPVQVSLSIGDDAGLTSVKAHFDENLDALND
jgi:hypothetical protein